MRLLRLIRSRRSGLAEGEAIAAREEEQKSDQE
jgi:hypothetical protein